VLLPECDYVFDFHSGGSSLTYIPSTLMRRPQMPEPLARGIAMLKTFGAPFGYLVDGGWGDHTLTAAAARAGVHHMSTECAGGGQVTPSALRIMESGIRRVLTHIGALDGAPPPAVAETRIMQVRGPDYYVYAPDPGLFEPLVELGDEVDLGTPAALIHPHDTPWREPATAAFSRRGTVICKRARPCRARRMSLPPCRGIRAVNVST
jgi:predicted deacylase